MISAITNKTVSFQAKKKIDNKEQQPNIEQKNNAKKVVLATTGLAAIGVAGVLLSKKLPKTIASLDSKRITKHSLNMIDDASKVKKEASKLYDDATGIIDDVLVKIKNAFTSNPESIKEEKGKKVFEEIVDGALRRKSTFTQSADDIILNTVETYKPNQLKDVVIAKKNKPHMFLSDLKGGYNYSGKSIGTKDADELRRLFFFNETGGLTFAQKDARKITDSIYSIEREFGFKNGILSSAKEGIKYSTNPSSTFVKRKYRYSDGIYKSVQESLGSIRTKIKESVNTVTKLCKETVFKVK